MVKSKKRSAKDTDENPLCPRCGAYMDDNHEHQDSEEATAEAGKDAEASAGRPDEDA